MAHYRVSQANGFELALEDAAGRRHLARALHDRLSVGDEFHGPRPACGFALLADTSSTRVCRVIFEAIDRGPQRVQPA